MRLIVFSLLFSFWCTTLCAQQDSVQVNTNLTADTLHRQQAVTDPAIIAKENREQFIADSIAMKLLIPDSLRENKFIKSFYKNPFDSIDSILNAHPIINQALLKGSVRTNRDPWLIAIILGLLIYTALLNVFLGNDIKNVLQSFYNKHAIAQLDKEGGVISSWAFIGLFLLFCLTSGLVLYEIMDYYEVYFFNIIGFQLFIVLSILISLLFALKFLILKFLGFVFDVNSLVSEYISILNLTYFTIAFVLLAMAICFSLISEGYIQGLLVFTLIAIAVIFAWQYLRNSMSIISNFRFHKFYLFVYLCALEICPVLILIKALNI